MKITLLTIFPESFESLLSYPVIKRAIRNGLVEIEVVDIRAYTPGSYRAIDDSPYGGGRGLLLKVDTMMNALRAIDTDNAYKVLMGPKGNTFNQDKAREYSKKDHLVLISGHYEGVDERFKAYIDEEVSIGDYILTGGESASAIIAEAVTRLLDGALREDSASIESFEDNLLEFPQYTHPEVYEGVKVPEELLKGNQEEISRYREREALKETLKLRPDLIKEDRDYKYFTLHRNAGKEGTILKLIEKKLPCPKVVYENEDGIILTRLKGKSIETASRSKILRMVTSALKRLWNIDISNIPFDEGKEMLLESLRKKNLSYQDWKTLTELEEIEIDEDSVFSHGNLTLENILANGSGLTGIIDFRASGISDRYRDLSSIVDSLEGIGISREELEEALSFKLDNEKLEYYRKLGQIR